MTSESDYQPAPPSKRLVDVIAEAIDSGDWTQVDIEEAYAAYQRERLAPKIADLSTGGHEELRLPGREPVNIPLNEDRRRVPPSAHDIDRLSAKVYQLGLKLDQANHWLEAISARLGR